MKEVVIYCDGSSLGNGQDETRAAAVALLGFRGRWKAVGRYLGNATNQQAEVAAATIGLEALREPCMVLVFSDSQYVIKTMTGQFRRKANKDWWQQLDDAASGHAVTWEWLRGHAGHELQEAVDRAAREIASCGRADQEILDRAARAASAGSG